MDNYYQILGVAPAASIDEIRSRYRFLAKAYHPDRFSDPETKSQAESEMKRINEAYAVLSNPEKRRGYDQKNGVGTEGKSKATGGTEQERSNSRKAEAIIKYFQEVENRWHHLLTPFPESAALRGIRKSINADFLVLLKKGFSPNAKAEISALNNEFNARLTGMLVTNICLGAEYAQNGSPKKYNLVDLEIVTTIPVQELIFQIFQAGLRNHVISERDIQEMGDNFARALFMLCEESQALGKSVGKNKDSRSTASPENSRSSDDPRSQPENSGWSSIKSNYCQACGQMNFTTKVTFHENKSYGFFRRHKKLEGQLCADCVEKYFWEMTGVTFVLGWWGLISLIVCPFYLISNLMNYLFAWEVRKYSNNLSNIAVGWKFTVVSIFCCLAFFLFISPTLGNSPSTPDYQTTGNSTSAISQTQRATSTIVYQSRPTPTKLDCLLWDEVSSTDAGKNLCVYGNVSKAYWGGNIYYMSFSDNPNAFRLIVLNGYYFEDIQGQCVMVKGKVKTYGKMPYIEVGENLSKCK